MEEDQRVTTQPEEYHFLGRDRPDIIIGERVVVFAPLTMPKLGPFNNIPLEELVKELISGAETQYIELMKKYGRDCRDFEITVRGGKFGVIFTRPMDVVEQTQIRQYRERLARGERPKLNDSQRVGRHRPGRSEDRLPDPSGKHPQAAL